MSWSTAEQLKAWWTPARRAARDREERLLAERYPEQYVAYIDDWNGDELVRTVLGAAHDLDEFHRLQASLDPEVRKRVVMRDTYLVNEWTIQPLSLE